jgi:hypothetical protein
MGDYVTGMGPQGGRPLAEGASVAYALRRVFDLDVLACPRCGCHLRVIATVQDSLAVQAILAHRARSGAPAPAGPAPPAPAALTEPAAQSLSRRCP